MGIVLACNVCATNRCERRIVFAVVVSGLSKVGVGQLYLDSLACSYCQFIVVMFRRRLVCAGRPLAAGIADALL